MQGSWYVLPPPGEQSETREGEQSGRWQGWYGGTGILWYFGTLVLRYLGTSLLGCRLANGPPRRLEIEATPVDQPSTSGSHSKTTQQVVPSSPSIHDGRRQTTGLGPTGTNSISTNRRPLLAAASPSLSVFFATLLSPLPSPPLLP